MEDSPGPQGGRRVANKHPPGRLGGHGHVKPAPARTAIHIGPPRRLSTETQRTLEYFNRGFWGRW